MEIEAKFRATPSQLATVASLRALGPYNLTPVPEPELQENRYYDTPDGRLAAAQHGLRVRHTGHRTLITFKGPSNVSADGVHRRDEYEFPGADPRPQSWPSGPARTLAEGLIGDQPLAPTVTVRTERRILHVERDGIPVAELCLDEGVLRGGPHERPFCELEIELLPDGAPADLDALAAVLGTLMPLVPEPRGKLQRALMLRDGAL